MKYSYVLHSLLFAGILVVGVDVSAADEKSPAAIRKDKKGRPLPGALGQLELNSADRTEVAQLLKDVSAKRREAGKNKELQAEIRKDYLDKLGEILGEQRMAEFKKLNAEMAKNRKKGSKGGKNGLNATKQKKKSAE